MKRLAPLLAFVPLLFACSSSSTGPVPEPPTAPADPTACGTAWQTILPRQTSYPPQSLLWNDGTLYYQRMREGDVAALPDVGGTARSFAPAVPTAMWIDGDRIEYADDMQLNAISLATGELTRLDAQPSDASVPGGPIYAQAIDDSFVYWYAVGSGPSGQGALWRMPRAGGVAVRTASLPADIPMAMAILGDQAVLAVSQAGTIVAPKAGGSDGTRLRGLSGLDEFMGFDDAGPLWSVATYDDAGRPSHAIKQIDLASDTPTPFWPTMPGSFDPSRVWSIGDAWLVQGSEPFVGGAHMSTWVVARDQAQAKRVGCDAMTNGGTIEAVAASPDAVFLIEEWVENGAVTWTIVRVPR